MKDFKNIIQALSESSNVRISDYYGLLGYRDKYSFYRYLKSHHYNTYFTHASGKIRQRTGKEYRMYSKDLIRLLNEHYISNTEWRGAYTDYLYSLFHDRTFVFLETKNEEIRTNLGNFVKARGIFYNYSLSTMKLAKETGICPYDCYKICNERFSPSGSLAHLDYNTCIPFVCFDSVKHSTRQKFIELIDILPTALNLTEEQKIIMQAYRMAISELLVYQQKTDEENRKRKINRQNMEEKRLKNIYREASKLFHPDVNKSMKAETVMKQVNSFYEKKDYHSIKNLVEKTTHTI
jgi:hypothetical protein